MNKLWEVFRYELIRNGRRKAYLATTFGLPLLIAVLMLGFHVYQSLQTVEESNPIEALSLESLKKAGYVDESGLFGEVPSRFEDVLLLYPDEASAQAALQADEIDAYLIFTADYVETGSVVLHMPNLQITLLSDGGALAEQMVYSTFATGLDGLRLQRLSNPMNITEYRIIQDAETGETSISTTGTDEAIEGGQFAIVYVFTILFFIALMTTNTYLMQTVIEERENRLLEILLSSIRPTQLLTGKIMAMACLGLFQLMVWIAGGILLFVLAGNLDTYAGILIALNIQIRPEWLVLALVYFVLMYLLFASVFGTIGAISGSVQEGSQYAGLVLVPTMIPYYFFSLIQAEPNGLVASVLSIIPLTSPITTISRMVITDIPLWQIVGSVALVALTAFAAMWMAGRIFRVQTLLSGQNFKIGDIPRLLFAENAPRKAKEA